MLVARDAQRFYAVCLHQATSKSALVCVNHYLVHALVAQDALRFYAVFLHPCKQETLRHKHKLEHMEVCHGYTEQDAW